MTSCHQEWADIQCSDICYHQMCFQCLVQWVWGYSAINYIEQWVWGYSAINYIEQWVWGYSAINYIEQWVWGYSAINYIEQWVWGYSAINYIEQWVWGYSASQSYNIAYIMNIENVCCLLMLQVCWHTYKILVTISTYPYHTDERQQRSE